MKLPSELSTSVDDLRSTLSHRSLEDCRNLLAACPDNMPSKRKVIETRIRKLERAHSIPSKTDTQQQGQKARAKAQEPGPLAAPARGRQIAIADLEVLPPVKRTAKKGAPMPLAEIEEHIRRIDAAISDRTRDYHNTVIYDIVGKGLMLLKGKSQWETVSHRSRKGGKFADEEDGFIRWIGEKFPDMQRRTAQNYMNAARNAGLTSDHSLEDVDALRTAMALHEKKPTDLYKITDKGEETPPPDNTPPPNLIAEFQLTFFAQLDEAVIHRDDMDGPTYEATWQRMQATLEKFTGARWIMADGVDNDAATHGEVHSRKANGTKPNKRTGGRRK